MSSAASSHQEPEHGPAKLRQFIQLQADLQLIRPDIVYTFTWRYAICGRSSHQYSHHVTWTDALLLVDVSSAASSHQEPEHGPAKLRQFIQLQADLQLIRPDIVYTFTWRYAICGRSSHQYSHHVTWTDALLLVDVSSAASSHQEPEHGPAKLRQFIQLQADLQLIRPDIVYTFTWRYAICGRSSHQYSHHVT